MPVVGKPREMSTRNKLRLVTFAWLFGAAWMYVVMGATVTQFLRAVNMPDWGFGVVAALPFVGALFRLPGSYILERFGRRRAVFLAGLSISRFMWVAAAAVPWIFPQLADSPHWWTSWAALVVVFLTLAWIGDAIGGIAWMNWMADVIPSRVRGRYFAFRQFAVIPVALGVMITVGLILDLAEQAETVTVLTITSCMIMVAGLLGVLDIQCFTRMPDDDPPRPSRHVRWLSKLGEPLRDRGFVRFLLFQFTFVLAVGFVGQYVWLFVLEQAEVPKLMANVMLLGVPLLIVGLSGKFWGPLIDRLGQRPVLIITGLMMVTGPFGWFIVTKDNWFWGYLLTCVSPFAMAGVQLSISTTVLSVSSASKRKPRSPICPSCGCDLRGTGRQRPCPKCGFRPGEEPVRGGSAYVAMHSLAMAVGGILSGLIGATVAKVAIDFQFDVPELGMELTYHHLLFAISSAIRAAAVIWALTIFEPGSAPVPEAMRVAGIELWSNFRRGITFPARAAVRVKEWTSNVNNNRDAA